MFGRLQRFLIIGSLGLAACFSPGRETAVKNAIEQVKETMDVAVPDIEHPEPYKYTGGGGDCALVPELPSRKEALRYQAEIPLPVGDDGRDRQARAIQHWIDNGATLRALPYRTGPPSEVEYHGGSITMFAMADRAAKPDQPARVKFYIVATTPCVAKDE